MKSKKSKIFKLISIIIFACGIVMLALSIFEVLKPVKTFNLVAILLLVIGFALYIRPMSKDFQNKNRLINMYRKPFYEELTKSGKLPTFVKLEENKNGCICYKNFVFQNLSFEDSLIVLKYLLNDFVIYAYAEIENKKITNKAKVEEFKVILEKRNGEVLETYLIKDYIIVNK